MCEWFGLCFCQLRHCLHEKGQSGRRGSVTTPDEFVLSSDPSRLLRGSSSPSLGQNIVRFEVPYTISKDGRCMGLESEVTGHQY